MCTFYVCVKVAFLCKCHQAHWALMRSFTAMLPHVCIKCVLLIKSPSTFRASKRSLTYDSNRNQHTHTSFTLQLKLMQQSQMVQKQKFSMWSTLGYSPPQPIMGWVKKSHEIPNYEFQKNDPSRWWFGCIYSFTECFWQQLSQDIILIGMLTFHPKTSYLQVLESGCYGYW